MKDAPAPMTIVLDRAEPERFTENLLERLRADASAKVLVLHGDMAPLTGAQNLLWVSVTDAPSHAEWAFLGRDQAGIAYLVAAAPANARSPWAGPWNGLREVGGHLTVRDLDAFATGLSLGRWLGESTYCSACGAVTHVHKAGWARLCPECGREHFPRTDPAVIVAVSSPDGQRLLLGSNAQWGSQRFSCFAGFVEAGESLEAAIVREVHEEAGVWVGDTRFFASQPWPYPRSLMVGFHAIASNEHEARPDGEEIVLVRWFSRSEIQAALAGESDLQLPGSASIARALISAWAEQE